MPVGMARAFKTDNRREEVQVEMLKRVGRVRRNREAAHPRWRERTTNEWE